MRKKVNKQLIAASVLATILTMLFMTFVFHGLLGRQIYGDLREYAKLLLFSEEYKGAELYQNADEITRVTWISENGTVLFDTEKEPLEMENHAGRPEFQEAKESGEGYAVRRSETLQKNTYYYAIGLSDGTVLRVARDAGSVWSLLFSAVPVMLSVLFIMIMLCVLLARWFTEKLLRPLTKLADNLERPEAVNVYKEMEPFVEKIRTQHETVLKGVRMRQDFTANVSHELKTPLTAISGYSELIETGIAKGEEVQRFAKEIHHNSNRLLALINDIIHLSEMDGESVQIPMQKTELFAVVKHTVETLRVSAEKRHVILTVFGTEAAVTANPDMLEELLWNLCDNAIRYNKENGCVNIAVECRENSVVLSVTDTGIGIPEEHRERIFERFYRVDKSRSKETGGTGLGLAIVKHIAAQHNAELELESEEGKGTKVSVVFPAAK